MTTAEVELPEPERRRLAELERVVDNGLATFVEVGRALAEINASRMYRATHSTFAEYAADRFGIGRSHAYRMISAARVAEIVSPIGDVKSEAVARELSGLPDNMARAAFDIAKGFATVLRGQPTPNAEEVREARRRLEERPIRIAETATPAEARERTDAIKALAADLADLGIDDLDALAVYDDVTEDEFEAALAAARQQGDLSRENVIANLPKTEPAIVTGLDGKTYHRPSISRKPPRKPLLDVAKTRGFALRQATESLMKVFEDDRYRSNEKQVADVLRGHLLYVAETVSAVLDQLP